MKVHVGGVQLQRHLKTNYSGQLLSLKSGTACSLPFDQIFKQNARNLGMNSIARMRIVIAENKTAITNFDMAAINSGSLWEHGSSQLNFQYMQNQFELNFQYMHTTYGLANFVEQHPTNKWENRRMRRG